LRESAPLTSGLEEQSDVLQGIRLYHAAAKGIDLPKIALPNGVSLVGQRAQELQSWRVIPGLRRSETIFERYPRSDVAERHKREKSTAPQCCGLSLQLCRQD
jgi:hypothetical protein